MARSFHALAGLSLFALAACSGAGNQDLFEGATEQNDTSTTLPSPSGASPSNPGAGTPATPPATNKDAGTTPPDPDPDPQPAKCTQEKEPNDDVAKATPFTTGLCGKIESGNDVDFGSFVVPPNAKSITWKHTESSGKLTYRFFIGGIQVPALDDDSLRVVPGATYAVQVKTASGNGGNRPSYELTVTIK